MNIVKTFLASSIVEFEQERKELNRLIRKLNDRYAHHDIYFSQFLGYPDTL